MFVHSTTSLTFVSESFDNVLQQVEHFHHAQPILKEQIREDQILKDGKVFSLIVWPSSFYFLLHLVCKVYL